jgi:hypothetical protein
LGYDGIPFRVKSLEEYKGHVDRVWAWIGKGSDAARKLRRVFIGGGNALAVDMNKLGEAINYTSHSFTENTGYFPRRIAVYGRTDAILRKGADGLSWFQTVAMSQGLIYWGIESGSDEVLKYVNKGYGKKQLLEAAAVVNDWSIPYIETSVMIMPGLGGMRFYDEHIMDTVEVLKAVKPKFITFMGINACPDTVYAKRILDEERRGENRRLNDSELAEQMASMLGWMNNSPTGFSVKVGCFGVDVDRVGHNPVPFGSRQIGFRRDRFEADGLIQLLRRESSRLRSEEKLQDACSAM